MNLKRERTLTIFNLKNSIIRLLLLAGISLAFLYGFSLFRPWRKIEKEDGIEVSIERGMTPKGISRRLKEKGVIRSESSFLLGAKLLGITRNLQAGRYLFQGRLTNYSVLRKLHKGRVISAYVTIPEGSRAIRIASILHKHLNIDSTRFMTLIMEPSFCASQGLDEMTLEGYLYPDTYRFHQNAIPEDIIKTMLSRFREVFVDSLKRRSEERGLSIHDVVTLASIVEGEAALDSERPTIAALYLNRLKRRMLLQADPTIQYLIKNGPRRLLNKDLEIDSPYNTYIYTGLPPGPVNNPGLSSILAVLYPDNVGYLYMVANGDGSHTFSRTMNEHLRAKSRFDRIRRNARRK